MRFVVETLDGGVSDRAAHPLDRAIRAGMSRMLPEQDTFCPDGLVSSGVHPLPAGSVKCVPLSVSTVWMR